MCYRLPSDAVEIQDVDNRMGYCLRRELPL